MYTSDQPLVVTPPTNTPTYTFIRIAIPYQVTNDILTPILTDLYLCEQASPDIYRTEKEWHQSIGAGPTKETTTGILWDGHVYKTGTEHYKQLTDWIDSERDLFVQVVRMLQDPPPPEVVVEKVFIVPRFVWAVLIIHTLTLIGLIYLLTSAALVLPGG